LLKTPEMKGVREELNLGARTRVLVINTEGATDPENYRRIVEEGL
jgi:diaminopropionate ammonia-lyase